MFKSIFLLYKEPFSKRKRPSSLNHPNSRFRSKKKKKKLSAQKSDIYVSARKSYGRDLDFFLVIILNCK